MLDFDVNRCTRRCHASGQELAPGETLYSTLVEEKGEILRRDFAISAWQGPPEGCVAWWKTRLPMPQQTGQRMAPPSVIVQLFEQMTRQQTKPALRFVLCLLMIRKKLLREEDALANLDQGHWVLRCPLNGKTYEVDEIKIDSRQAAELQGELVELLYGEAAYDVDEVLEPIDESDASV